MAWLTDFPVILLYGTYDHPVGECENNNRYRCITHYMPNTTWTEGRNALTKVALCDEEKRGEQSSYFVYSDDDVTLTCKDCTDEHAWRRYLHILTTVMPHTGSPVLALMNKPEPDGKFIITGSYDAFINAFDRRFLPLLLPYATLPHATSEWHSQAVHILVMFACFGQSAVVPLSLGAINGEHHPYPRGLNTTLINIVAQDSYKYYIDLKTTGFNYDQFARKEGPFITVAEVASRVSFHLTNKSSRERCSPLNRRFKLWKDSMGDCVRVDRTQTGTCADTWGVWLLRMQNVLLQSTTAVLQRFGKRCGGFYLFFVPTSTVHCHNKFAPVC